jgi:DNA-binding NarL/FixJ family response regulator
MPDQFDFRSEEYSWVFRSTSPPRREIRVPIRILVVDDHRLFAESLALTLEIDRRFEVVGFARNGVEGVELARELRPDVVLMDLQMPRMDGVEATRLIRRLVPEAKVVAMSGAAPGGMVDRAYEAGAVGFVGKDRPADELADAILRVSALGRPFGLRLLVDDPDASWSTLQLRPTG